MPEAEAEAEAEDDYDAVERTWEAFKAEKGRYPLDADEFDQWKS